MMNCDTHPGTYTTGANRPGVRRGVAMLLVIVAMGVGTVLAATALSSRENSPAIGANARDFAAASWSAQAGAALTMAILETNVDWLSLTEGSLLNDFAIAGGSVNVNVTNLAGLPPSGSERELIITVTSSSGQMSSTIHKRISVVPSGPIDNSVNPFLDEFAAYVVSSLSIEDNAQIKPSHLSPEAWSLFPIKVGVGFSSLGSLDIGANAKISRAGLFVSGNASAGLAGAVNTNVHFGHGDALPLQPPAFPVALPSEIAALPVQGTSDVTVAMPRGKTVGSTAPDLTIEAPGKYGNVNILANGIMRIDEANGEHYEFASINIGAGGTLQVSGKVVIHVKGKFTLQPLSNIDLVSAESAVRFLVSDDVEIDNASFGLGAAFSTFPRHPAELTTYYNPARFRILTVNEQSGGKASPTIRIRNNSVVLACIHAPNADVEIRDNSYLLGRVTAANLRVRSGSGIHYEPLLDSRKGYAARYGPLYENNAPLPEVLTAISGYVVGEGAESITGKVIAKAKQKWAAQPEDAWFEDDNDEALLDPFVDATVVNVVETVVDTTTSVVGGTSSLLGGLLGGGGSQQPVAPPPQEPPEVIPADPPAPTEPTRRFAGKVVGAPIAWNARVFEGLASIDEDDD